MPKTPSSTPPVDSNRSTPTQLRSKLGTYLTGVAIGFFLLGTFYYQKHKATQRQQANQQLAEQLADQDDDLSDNNASQLKTDANPPVETAP